MRFCKRKTAFRTLLLNILASSSLLLEIHMSKYSKTTGFFWSGYVYMYVCIYSSIDARKGRAGVVRDTVPHSIYKVIGSIPNTTGREKRGKVKAQAWEKKNECQIF